MDRKKINPKIGRARLITRASFIIERAAAHGWRFAPWVLFFCGLWMIGTPGYLGDFSAILASFIFFTGIAFLIYKDVLQFRLPSHREVDRRIEKTSGLTHNPLAAIDDKLANPEPETAQVLWGFGLRRAAQSLNRIRAVFPAPVIAAQDPYALRFATLLFFCLGLLIAGPDWHARIIEGMAPFSFAKTSATEDITMTVTPPAYTGLQPAVLHKSGAMKLPVGTMLKATVHGGLGVPYLATAKGDINFISAGGSDYALETKISEGSSVTIKQLFIPRAKLNYVLLPDAPPSIDVKGPPVILPEGQIRFPLTLKDDYGVRTLTMHMELEESLPPDSLGAPITETRSVMSGPNAATDIQPVYDFAAHFWAGLPVKITFEAIDALGQKTAATPIKITLPQRKFTQPLAQRLAGLRQKIIQDPLHDYDGVRQPLEEILGDTATFQGDIVITLALRSAASRLFWAGPSINTAGGVASTLWQTALRIEDGNYPQAARDLRDAQAALENALNDPNTSKEEIARLMSELRSAMTQYMSELQREIQRRIAQGRPPPLVSADALAKVLNPDSLAAMMDEMEAKMMSGDKDAARKMLSELQNMMDGMNPSSESLPPDAQAMMEGLKNLRELIKSQEDLLGKTKNGSEPSPQLQTEQESIRHALGEAMRKAGEALPSLPPGMGLAEQEMRGSSTALGDGKLELSAPHQEKALEDLRQGQQELSQKFLERLQSMQGLAMGGMKLDPLGRPYGEGGPENSTGSNVKIPDEAQRKQAQEILRLLRKRAGEFDRPAPELDYYHRLLRQF